LIVPKSEAGEEESVDLVSGLAGSEVEAVDCAGCAGAEEESGVDCANDVTAIRPAKNSGAME
jgi:hypothetical protein